GVTPDDPDVVRFLGSFAVVDPELSVKARAAAAEAQQAAEWKAREEREKQERNDAARKAHEAFLAARYDGRPVPPASELKGLVLYVPFDEGTGDTAADAVSGQPAFKLSGGAKFVPGARGSGVDVSGPGLASGLGPAIPAFRYAKGDSYTLAVWYRTQAGGLAVHASSADQAKDLAKLTFYLGWGEAIVRAESTPVWDARTAQNRASTQLRLPLNQARADDDRWHHMAFTSAAGADMNLFIDGRLVLPWPYKTEIDLRAVERVQLGGPSPDPSTLSGHFDGQLDELCVFDRALTADEVKKLAARR
ncbi:MAG: LamG domain-containing protein, partial [Gemmataceae bacterium]|nr:LamG domain-containing protein [Gemmataceae bacterium]